MVVRVADSVQHRATNNRWVGSLANLSGVGGGLFK